MTELNEKNEFVQWTLELERNVYFIIYVFILCDNIFLLITFTRACILGVHNWRDAMGYFQVREDIYT